jgi:hypothetical protein
MWHIEFPIDSELEPEAVWDALVALETGAVPKANGDRHQLDGALELGGIITSSSEGIPPVKSTIVELVENHKLAIETDFKGLILLLRHTVRPLDGGGTRLIRRLEITGSSADDQAAIAGPRISDDYAEAVAEVIEIARSRA